MGEKNGGFVVNLSRVPPKIYLKDWRKRPRECQVVSCLLKSLEFGNRFWSSFRVSLKEGSFFARLWNVPRKMKIHENGFSSKNTCIFSALV